jgi:uncharacterized membrane protein
MCKCVACCQGCSKSSGRNEPKKKTWNTLQKQNTQGTPAPPKQSSFKAKMFSYFHKSYKSLIQNKTSTEATSLDWKISVFGKSLCSATACWWEIVDILSLKRWENSVGHI